MRSIITAFIAMIALPCAAQTPQWYAANPEALNTAIARCRDPLGGIKLTPECKAAEQGLYQFAADQGYAHLKQREAADQAARERKWRSDPNALAEWMRMCREIPQDQVMQRFAHCAEAVAISRESSK